MQCRMGPTRQLSGRRSGATPCFNKGSIKAAVGRSDRRSNMRARGRSHRRRLVVQTQLVLWARSAV